MSEVIKATTGADLVAAITVQMGFTPADSLVVVGLKSNPETGAMRFHGIVRVDAADWILTTDPVTKFIREVEAEQVFVAGFDLEFSRLATFAAYIVSQVPVLGVLHIADGDVMFTNGTEPTTVESLADVQSSKVLAEAVTAGIRVGMSREEVAQTWAHGTHPAALLPEEVQEAMKAAQSDPLGTLEGIGSLLAAGERGEIPSAAEVAPLLGIAARSDCRDWILLVSKDHPATDEMVEFWRVVLTLTPSEYATPVCALAALTAWRAGHGAEASIVADQALEIGVDNTLVEIVLKLLANAVPPQFWQTLANQFPTTPVEVFVNRLAAG